jgi:cytochrome c-type biogenesis protein CcmH
MRGSVIAAAAVVFVVATAPGQLVQPTRAADRPNAAELESELVCVTCKTTLDESDSPIARRMKAYIRRRIAAGATGKEIKDELVAEFGQEVLATPPTHGFDLLAWVLPIGGIGAGAVGLGGLAWVWSRRREGGGRGDPGDGVMSQAGDRLDPELERRVDEALARFED